MKPKMKIIALLIMPLLIMMANHVFAQSETHDDKTLSPYFFVKTDDPDLDRMPLKSTSVDVQKYTLGPLL